MIKNKIVFGTFIILLLILFPYSILLLIFHSDILSSVIPGWNTTIYPIGAIIKLPVLSITVYYFWKLSKITKEIDLKKVIVYLLLTIPAVIITKLNLFQLVNFGLTTPENFESQIIIVVIINIIANTLFFTGQILFGFYYIKQTKKLT
ncbi:hypothetical protein B0A68_17720 [Flavobacterium reichenbachii]|uniref:Uncharacterized protein n=1 Tax=Flavobacterium reichenbachii TaxID=362418 RepID=A0A085ZMS6_9FLAO|nr:hypothetical protein IW19_09510 [Flavobacterium reichenbachii]OXB12628.1 hypothetical protein B0A68_17720 [Flavobacterium reichenbachii]